MSKSSKRLRFACCCACFDAKNYVHYIRHMKCNENSVQTSKYSHLVRKRAYFSSKSSKWLHFACSWAYFDDETGVHSIIGVKSSKYNVKSSKYLQQERHNDQYSSKSSKCLRYACCCACFDAKNYVHYIRYVKCNENSV